MSPRGGVVSATKQQRWCAHGILSKTDRRPSWEELVGIRRLEENQRGEVRKRGQQKETRKQVVLVAKKEKHRCNLTGAATRATNQTGLGKMGQHTEGGANGHTQKKNNPIKVQGKAIKKKKNDNAVCGGGGGNIKTKHG